MANKELSGLTAASTLDGTESVYVVQGGNSRRATAQAIANLKDVSAYLTIAAAAAVYQPLAAALTALATAFSAAAASGPASLAFAEDTDNGSNKVTVIAPASLASDFTFTLPAFTGTPALIDAADQTITGGARVTVNDLGTISSGTVTPDPGDRPHQKYVNGGAHTLAPGTNQGSYWLDITNNGSAGAVTTSGWTKVVGTFATTNALKYACVAHVSDLGSLLTIQAMQ